MKRHLLKTHTLSYSSPGTALSANEIKRIGLLKNEWHFCLYAAAARLARQSGLSLCTSDYS